MLEKRAEVDERSIYGIWAYKRREGKDPFSVYFFARFYSVEGSFKRVHYGAAESGSEVEEVSPPLPFRASQDVEEFFGGRVDRCRGNFVTDIYYRSAGG